MQAPLIALAAGGTGGHLFPAQALAEELGRRQARVLLVTDHRGARYTDNFPCSDRFIISAASSTIGGPIAAGRTVISVAAGFFSAAKEFKKRGVDAAIGFGGYPSLPSMKAAAWMRIPHGIHEQNGVLGRANRLLAGDAEFVAHAFGILERVPAKAKGKLVELGNPVRDNVAQQRGGVYGAPGQQSPIELLVFGGSQGASIFSEIVPNAISALPDTTRKRLSIAHQARQGEIENVRAIYGRAKIAAVVAPFFSDLPSRMAKAHLIISRAGASTVTEIAIIGRPSILVPLAIAMDDHQSGNARALGAPGAAIVIPECDFKVDKLASMLDALLLDGIKLSEMAAATGGRVKSGAAVALADLALGLVEGRKVAR